MKQPKLFTYVRVFTVFFMLLAAMALAIQPAYAEASGNILVDRVWLDANGDGLQGMNEVGKQSVTVNLYTCDGIFIATKLTTVSGYTSFENIEPGNYFVEFEAPAGFAFTLQDQGTNDLLDSDADPVTGRTICFTLLPGATKGWDAGLVEKVIVPASLGDYVWEDTNGDGIQNDGMTGIGNVQVDLYTCADILVAGTFTDGSGFYSFTGLMPGNYYVQFTAPGGFVFTTRFAGDTPLDSNADTSGMTECITLASGDNNTSIDAGLFRPASLGDFVWNDTNNNGLQDGGEIGIESVKVDLYTCTGDFIASVFTDSTGFYSFMGLMPGSYYVVFTKPAGYFFSPQNVGSNELIDSDADPVTGQTGCVTLVSGQNYPDLDAGLNLPMLKGSLGDFVWLDSNANGVFEPGLGELPISSVVVELYNCSGNFLASDVTDGMGYYLFTNLMASCYEVVVAASNFNMGGALYGFSQTFDYDGFLDNRTTYNLGNGQDFLAADFGYRPVQAPGTGTPGYWKNHPEAWPVESINIGGVTYTKPEAIAWMMQNDRHDKTTTMFRSLVSAKLNVAVGNQFSCIANTITAADAWMAMYGPVGSKLRANTDAWRVFGEPLYLLLDAYNNGLSGCAPHRD